MLFDCKCYLKKLNKIVMPKNINFFERTISVSKKSKNTALGFFSDIYKFEDVIFLHYSGKKTGKGKKLYRGDIVKFRNLHFAEQFVEEVEETATIVFKNFKWQLECNSYTLDFSEIDPIVFSKMEVLGNSYLEE